MKISRTYVFAIFFVHNLFAMSGFPLAAADIQEVTNDSIAIDRALQYTGFDKADGFSKSDGVFAKLERRPDDNTPFVWDKNPLPW